MAMVLVNNISDRTVPPGGPRAVDVGPETIWPGRCALVSQSELTPSLLSLRGTFLEFGHLPAGYLAKPPPSTDPMTEDELLAYLGKLSLKELHALADGITPVPPKKETTARMARIILRACRDLDSLDPATFFFTRNWTRVGPDTFVPVG